MKKRFLIILLIISGNVIGQKPKETNGDPKNLGKIKEYLLVFDYSGLEIPKYDSEKEFLEDKARKKEEKQPGLGEEFKKSWFADREEYYEPKFVRSFNKRFEKEKILVDRYDIEARYTMKIHTNKIYSGYNVGVLRKNAEIDVTISVYETENPSKVLFSGKFYNVQGEGSMGYDYNSGYRISECYAKAAKSFAGYLKKKALK